MKKKFLLSLLLFAGCVLSACNFSEANGNENNTEQKQDTPAGDGEFIDYAHNGSVQLPVNYQGKDFFKDGIGQVTLASKIDGDTAHFNPVVKTTSSEKIKARFYGIDTPESTGKIEPFGHGASVFTSTKLENAQANGTIVIVAPGYDDELFTGPAHDSTGSRYLGLIWINETVKNAPYNTLTLLNLLIVQEGWSWVYSLDKCLTYKQVFLDAEAQAKAFKKNLFSGADDPDFNYGDYETTSILDLKIEIEEHLKDKNHVNKYDNKKVRVTGTVGAYVNGTMYLQCFYSKENGARKDEGEWAGINIYCGTSNPQDRFTAVGACIMLCGTALDSDTFGFQISGVNFPRLSSKESDNTARVIFSPEENDGEYKLNRFEMTAAQLSSEINSKNYSHLNCAVKITDELTCTSCYVNADGDEFTLTMKSNNVVADFSVYVVFGYAGDPSRSSYNFTKTDFEGKTYKVQGVFTFHEFSTGKISYQISPGLVSDLVCTTYATEA